MVSKNNFTIETPLFPHKADAKAQDIMSSPKQKPRALSIPKESKRQSKHKKAFSFDFGNQFQSTASIDNKQCRIDLKTQKDALATCYLKTKNQRFKEFILSLEGSTINFSRHFNQTGELSARHQISLSTAHIKQGPKVKSFDGTQTFT